MILSCKFEQCGASFEDKECFVSHIEKNHQLKIQDYFHKYDPKKDLLTGEPISFKSLDQYLLTDFCDKRNMLKWLKENQSGPSSQYLSGSVASHSLIKSVRYFPSSSEIRSISYLPSMKTYEFFFKDLNAFIDSTGLIRRFDYNLNEKKLNFISAENITIDTREQKPLKFKGIECFSSKLEFGDYSSDGIVAVERKSLSDLVSTLSSGFERFNREVERARSCGGYIVVVTECDINKFLSFNYSRAGKFSKASVHFILHRLRDIMKKFPTDLQFCFSGSRARSSEIIPKILNLSLDQVRNLDFQYLIEKSII